MRRKPGNWRALPRRRGTAGAAEDQRRKRRSGRSTPPARHVSPRRGEFSARGVRVGGQKAPPSKVRTFYSRHGVPVLITCSAARGPPGARLDRKSVVEGKRVDLRG